MAMINIRDRCLAPEYFIRMAYSGPNPWGVAKKITETIRPFFHVSASGMSNWRINWDITGDPILFYSLWKVMKDFSGFTEMRIKIKIKGEVGKTSNSGKFTLRLEGNLFTKFSGWKYILKPVWMMYSYLFYNRMRRKYIEMCRNYVYNFRNEIKEHFNLEATQVPEREASYG